MQDLQEAAYQMRRDVPTMVLTLQGILIETHTYDDSRNCTKHNCRCDYMDQPAAGEEPLKGSAPPDLMMSTELQGTLDQWRITGECPIAELRTTSAEYWMHFSTIDLRLIHHISTLSIDLHNRGYAQCTSWAPKMPM